jgi:FKBP-type peptidyl-prolyl cis-trans isomerase 2
MMRQYALLLALLVIFGCLQPQVSGNNTTEVNVTEPPNTTVVSPVNTTQNTTEPSTPVLPPNYKVSIGDRVWVNYTLWVNDSVYDTNNESLAKEAGIYSAGRAYEPFSYVVQFNQGVIDGFIINTVGLMVNETVVFDVDPERGYGFYDQSKVVMVPRYYNRSVFETVPREYLESMDLDLTVGTAYETEVGMVFINQTNEDNITLFYILVPGHKFTLNGVPQQVVNASEDYTVTIEHALNVDKYYTLPHPGTGMPTRFLVTNKSAQDITLDANHPLANETLTFEVTLLKVEPFQN